MANTIKHIPVWKTRRKKQGKENGDEKIKILNKKTFKELSRK
jgi:hypothetical protein